MVEYLAPLLLGAMLGFGAGYAYGVLRSAQIIARHKNKKG